MGQSWKMLPWLSDYVVETMENEASGSKKGPKITQNLIKQMEHHQMSSPQTFLYELYFCTYKKVSRWSEEERWTLHVLRHPGVGPARGRIREPRFWFRDAHAEVNFSAPFAEKCVLGIFWWKSMKLWKSVKIAEDHGKVRNSIHLMNFAEK